MIDQLIRDELEEIIDPEPWEAAKTAEAENKKRLQQLDEDWESVVGFLRDLNDEDRDDEDED